MPYGGRAAPEFTHVCEPAAAGRITTWSSSTACSGPRTVAIDADVVPDTETQRAKATAPLDDALK